MSVEIDLNGVNTKTVECICIGRSKAFTVVVIPSLVDGSARLIEMYCLNCGRGTKIMDGYIGVREAETKTDVITDRQGRKHHCLKAETGYLKSGGFN